MATSLWLTQWPGGDSLEYFRMKGERGSSPDSTGLHVRNLLDCVRSRKRPAADVQFGHHATNVADMANIAYKTGRKLRWDEVGECFVEDGKANRLLFRTPRRRRDVATMRAGEILKSQQAGPA